MKKKICNNCKSKNIEADKCMDCGTWFTLPTTKSEECKLHPPFHQSDDLKCNHCCECKCHLEGRRSPCEKSCCQKQDQPAGWESRFGQVWGGYNASEDTRGLDARIKDFIRSELAIQKQNLIREVEKMLIPESGHTGDELMHYEEGYSDAMEDILSLLKGESR